LAIGPSALDFAGFSRSQFGHDVLQRGAVREGAEQERPNDDQGTAPLAVEAPPDDKFWDFKASHWVTAVLTLALVCVGFQQIGI
jgi:hypothetical protein